MDNTRSNVVIYTAYYDETINNFREHGCVVTVGGSHVTIYGAGGNDDMENYLSGEKVSGTYVVFYGGTGRDFLRNGGNYSSMIGNEGSDTIKNLASYCLLDGSEDNDTVGNYDKAEHVTIHGGSGNDSLNNGGVYSDWHLTLWGGGDYAFINGDDGNDYINNEGENSTADGGSGNDYIHNSVTWVSISGGSDNDTLNNSDCGDNYYVTLNGGDGNDSIYNDSSYVTIDGEDGYDIIQNYGDQVSISGGAGNDSINNAWGSDTITIEAGTGNDTIQNWGSIMTINGSYGNDYIENHGGYINKYDGGSGNDTIISDGDNSTITGGEGNDNIENHGSTVSVDLGAGNDYIWNYNSYNDIHGQSGDDTVINLSSHVLIEGGSGNDSLYGNSNSDYSTILGQGGNDSIENNGNNVTINAGEGNDTIYNNWDFFRSIIYDNYWGSNVLFLYNAGDGDDIIYGFRADSTLSIAGGAVSTAKSGSDIIVTVGGSKISLKGAGNLSKVNIIETPMNISNSTANKVVAATNQKDTIKNSGEKAMIIAYNGDDTISNTSDSATLDGGAGNDTLWNDVGGAPAAGKKVSISGGAGNDFISNDGDNSTAQGGADNDTIQNWGDSSKIYGGAGNDSINNHSDIGNNSFIDGGDGADTIVNNGSNVTIQAQGGNDSISNLKDGTNSIILSGSGNDSIANGQAQAKLNGEAGNDYIYNDGNTVTIEGGTGNDTIQNNGTSGYGENVIFKYNDGDGNDLIRDFRENSTLSIDGGVYATTTKSGKDIIVSVGTGKITLQGAGSLSKVNIVETPINKTYSKSNTTIYGTNANDTITNTGDKVTIQALRGNDSISNSGQNVSIDGSEDNDKISNTGKNATLIGGNGAESISNHAINGKIYGGAGADSLFNNSQKVTISGGNDNDVIENNTDSNNVSIAGEAGNDSIDNKGNNVTIAGGAGNDSISSKSTSTSISTADGNDLVNIQGSYKNTINAGKGSDTIKLDMNSTETFIQHALGDGNDLIEGFNSTATLQIGNGNNTYSRTDNGNDIIITDEGGAKLTLKGAATLSSVHIDGVTTLNVENDKSETVISGDRLNDFVINNGSSVTIDTFAASDTVSNYSRYVIVDLGTGKDFIVNRNANNSSINAGDGDDEIDNSGGYKNTIYAGKGTDDIFITSSEHDLIIYNSGDGNDYITDFNETATLQIGDGTGSYYKEVTSDGNIIITVDKYKITLDGAESLSTLNIFGVEEIEGNNYRNRTDDTAITATEGDDSIRNTGSNVVLNALGGNDSVVNSRKNVTIDAGRGYDTISSEGDSVSINAGAGNDSIYNDGGNNVTIIGGMGNDSISNNWDYDEDGSNALFVYNSGDGNDIIDGFKTYSTLSIAGGLYSLRTSGNDVIVKVDDGQITLKGVANLPKVNIIGVQDKPASNIKNSDSSVSISGGDSKDTITNSGQNVTVLAYGGNDTIFNNRGDKSFVDGGEGNDTINNKATYATIIGGAGNDSIYNGDYGNQLVLDGGAGNDRIKNTGSDNSISGGEGNDYIDNSDNRDNNNVTINAGTGNDTINNDSNNILFQYNTGDGNDSINGFKENSTLQIDGGSGAYSTQKSGNNIIVIVGEGKITLSGAANLSRLNISGDEKKSALHINNTISGASITGTKGDDTISNEGEDVIINALGDNDLIANNGGGNESTIEAGDGNDTIANNHAQEVIIEAQGGNDSISNNGNFNTLDGGAGNDTLSNANGFYSSLSGAAGDDLISIDNSSDATLNGGTGNDTIELDPDNNALIEYKSGDGNDIVDGFGEDSTLQISDNFSTAIINNDVIVTVGEGKVTLTGAASLDDLNIEVGDDDDDNSASFVVMNSNVIANYAVRSGYQYNQNFSVLNVSSALDNPVKITNSENSSIKANGAFGTAILSSGNVLEYEENNVALTSENHGDKITFDEDSAFNYGEIQANVLKGSVLSTNGAKEITFDNNSSANITAPAGAKFNINSGIFVINNLPVNSTNGKGTITVNNDGLTFSGYGVQFVDLEVAKESYFGKLTAMTAAYNSTDKSYTIQNTACVKTLSDDFTKLTFNISAAENYAYYKVNDVEFLVDSDAENINVIEADGNIFKIQDKEVDAENIGRVTIDEQLTFSGTEIDYDGVIINYAHNKPVIYSADGKEITLSDAATVTLGENTKTFKCEAGSYTVNGRGFETSTDLTFTAGTSEIKIPLSDKTTEIYFDGVQVSGDSGEIVFDLANDKISIPDGAELNFTSHEDIKLNLAAGNFIIDEKNISTDNELEITANKESLQIPLSENAVTINDAKITGNGEMTIDNTNALFFAIHLPDGAFVENPSVNTFELAGKNTSASFGGANKKVQLTEDGTAYINFDDEKGIGVGFNTLTFENVEIEGVDAWTVETSGTSGIDKITGITDGATLSTSTRDIDAGDLRFEVETKGAGSFTIGGQKITSTSDTKNIYIVSASADGEIKVVPQGEEYADDNSEAAGKVYNFDKAGDYTVNGITFHAAENSTAQTITRGVELDLSSGSFQYDGLTLSGNGTAQINRYNANLVSLTDGAKVSGDDETKYQNRQFEIEGAVEIIGKKFETDEKIRCALLNVEDSLDFEVDGETVSIPFTLSGFIANDKYVQIKDECYETVKVVGKKISSIEGVKASASILGSGLSNISIVTTESGEFSIHGRQYKISDDSDGVTFVTGSHGNVIEINGLQGSVEGNFENEVSVNGKAIRLSSVSSIKVTSDGEKITEIANVAGDLVTTDGKSYRKNVRVYELGGAEKLTTSADGIIIFNGNKFKTSAGKTFTLDEEGNVSGIEKAQAANVSANVLEDDSVAENFATINLTTTNGLEEVFGDFSEGLTVNGVFVKVTDSTNFVVKDDDQNVYIETTAPDTFTINGKTFTTSADKTIFKLDASGNVSEIVTDTFYPDEEAYQIEGDFNDEIIFNGKKFCVTGTKDTSIFLSDESLITIKLARNAVEVVENGGVDEIAISGAGEITVGGKTFTTSNDFVGTLKTNSIENFVGTIEGELGGLELEGLIIESEDNFSVTGDGEKITAIENLQNGSFTCGNLNGITINGAKVSVDNSDEITLMVTDGELKITGLANGANVFSSDEKVKFVTAESGEFFVNGTTLNAKADDTFVALENSAKVINSSSEEFLNKLIKEISDVVTVNADNRNVTLKGGEAAIVENTSAKVNITASKGQDTIYTSGSNVDIDLKAGGATEIFATEGQATVENYKATSGAAFLTENENIADAIEENSIAYDDGRLNVNSARVTFAEDADSRIINFVNAADELQKVGFVSDDSKLDASKEKGSLILVGASNSTLAGGKGQNQIYLDDNSESTILLNGKNTIHNFSGDDKISVSAANSNFSFDGEKVKIKSGTARATLENISSDGDAARILTVINGKETKTAIAQAGAVIAVGNDTADAYYGEKSGVDFSDFENSLTVDLRENFNGINRVTVGGGLNTLISSSQNETLTGNGTTEYIFDKDSGRDVISNFDFDEDKINVGTNAVTNVRIDKAGGVRMEIGGSAVLTLENAQGKNFKINNFVAIADENLTYNATANYFVATAQNASLTVGESAEIWLDGSHGKTFDGDIRTLDASTAQGKTSLAGNDLDNRIFAGQGDATLWGGSGGDDLLVGGTGKNTFYYLQGNGSDTIANAHDGDIVYLSTVTLDQISGTSITGDAVSINFKDGGSLQVNSNANVTYQLADGSKFSANHAQSSWIARS